MLQKYNQWNENTLTSMTNAQYLCMHLSKITPFIGKLVESYDETLRYHLMNHLRTQCLWNLVHIVTHVSMYFTMLTTQNTGPYNERLPSPKRKNYVFIWYANQVFRSGALPEVIASWTWLTDLHHRLLNSSYLLRKQLHIISWFMTGINC